MPKPQRVGHPLLCLLSLPGYFLKWYPAHVQPEISPSDVPPAANLTIIIQSLAMADLNYLEKQKFERLLEMGAGYVLDFTNRSFQEFVAGSTHRQIFDPKYDYNSGSKANRLRAFWKSEPNHVVGKLLSDLLDYCSDRSIGSIEHRDECRRIANRLLKSTTVQDLEVITPNAAGRDFEALAKAVRDSIENNEPEAGLDRLHTFVVKYLRELCVKNQISIDRDKPLHGLMGEYVKHLQKSGKIESEMAERILKSTISLLAAFNQVRNEHSFAHANPILGYEEGLLIFNSMTSCIRFLRAVDASAENVCAGEGDPPS